MPLIFCGIDPGVTGALAFLDVSDPSRVVVYDMPEANKQIEPTELAELIRRHAPLAAVVQQQGPKPTDGCRQSFSIGGRYWRPGPCSPSWAFLRIWRRHPSESSTSASTAKDPKEAGRALALRLWPADAATFRRKADHNRSDSALIARFAAETLRSDRPWITSPSLPHT